MINKKLITEKSTDFSKSLIMIPPLSKKSSKSSFDEIKLTFPFLDTAQILEALKQFNNDIAKTVEYLFNKEIKVVQRAEDSTGPSGLLRMKRKRPESLEEIKAKEEKLKELLEEIIDDIKDEFAVNKGEKNLTKIENILSNYVLKERERQWEDKIEKTLTELNKKRKTCSTVFQAYKKHKQDVERVEILKSSLNKMNEQSHYLLKEKQSLELLLQQYDMVK